MRGEKENTYPLISWSVHPDWAWAHLKLPLGNQTTQRMRLRQLLVDPSNLMADVDKSNNYYAPDQPQSEFKIKRLKGQNYDRFPF